MHCLGSILGEERIEEIVEIIFFRKSSFIKYHGFYVALIQFFYPRANGTFGTPFGGWFWLHRVDLSVQEGDR